MSRGALARVARLLRPLGTVAALPPVPPALPPGRTLVLPGRGETFVRDSGGGGPAIVLLHGWTQTADLTWWRTYTPLSAIGRVIAIDHRGHGRGIRSLERFTLEDAADDVAAMVRELGAGPAIVCGFSMGGPIAMLTWQRHPDLVRGLVLVATALEWNASVADRMVWRTMAIIERVFRSTISTSVIDRLLRELVDQCPSLDEHRDWLRGELRRGDPTAIADAGRALGRFDGRPIAAGVDVPSAVVVTVDDHMVPPRKQRALARAIRGAPVFDLDGDHDACYTSVDEFAAVTTRAVLAMMGVAPASR